MGRKSWQIENLDVMQEYCQASGIILKNRITQLKMDINKYFYSESAEALHRIRISLRRLRYSMELFISCYDNEKFMIFYKRITKLQDLSGKARDFDVMSDNLSVLMKEDKVRISIQALNKVLDLRNELKVKLKSALSKFIRSKAVRSFEELL